MSLREDVERALAEIEAARLLRAPRTVERVRGAVVTIDGRDVVSFCSNDYLGLSQDPRLAEAAARAARDFGWGAGSSRLLGGTTKLHIELEERFAAWKGEEAALFFPSGYAANVGLLSAIADEETLIASDALNHASVIDGCRLSRAKVERYRHADAEDAARALARPAKRKLLVTDAVFSMDGDLAPLPELLRAAETAGAQLVVDDAHGTGVLGEGGRGTLAHFGLAGRGVIETANLAKAGGASGGFVVGPAWLRRHLVNRSRAFMFTTGTPAPVAAVGIAAVEAMEGADDARRRVRENAARLGVPAPIKPVVLGSNEAALAASARLWERGFFVPAIRPPTVPEGSARLRVSVTALHAPAQVDALIDALG